jgi:hypothetical protein
MNSCRCGAVCCAGCVFCSLLLQEFVGGVPKLTPSVFAPFANGNSKSFTLFGTSTKPSGLIKIRLNTLVQGIKIVATSLLVRQVICEFQAQSPRLQLTPMLLTSDHPLLPHMRLVLLKLALGL